MGRGTPSKNGPNTSKNLQNKFGAFMQFPQNLMLSYSTI